MKNMVIGLLALGSITAQANDCVIKNVSATFENKENQQAIIDQLISKGYIFSETAESGLYISVGIQKQGPIYRQQQRPAYAEKQTLGLKAKNALFGVKKSAQGVYDTVSTIGKSSEYLLISDTSGNQMFVYSKNIGLLGNENKSTKRLIRLMPSCGGLNN